ncbi:dihydroneopterin aldolase [Puniceicoccus vermicola]|uniref:7,8-dihydroneopterin aldolase n=1 Tax=Puniceicoccus vermicola TaxID=388746 RepID=A0A7X1AX50_9BACT|nr:dihydroneopterin aldolase [Puniceicoccus vermicola]MBC2601542.1 dihydroneopterin aldolase [Puniceicoccus vermicola]
MKESPDLIRLRGLAFFGFHGNNPAEAEFGQRFFVDLELRTDVCEAGKSDNLEHAVDYSAVYLKVRHWMEQERFHLLEALATRIAEGILEDFARVSSVVVEVRKPQAPLPGIFDEISVSVERCRQE